MRAPLGLIAALIAAVSLLAVNAGQALANHVQCSDVITQDTMLDSDLSCTGDALVVRGSDLTLDLGGHTVRGDVPGGAVGYDIGIELDGSRITVQNGRVEDFAFDITLGSSPFDPPSSSSEDLIRRLQLVDSGSGVSGDGGNGNRIEDNRFVKSGMDLYRASDALVQRNSFDQRGIFLDQFGGGGSVVRANVALGLGAYNGDDLTVERNRFSEGIEIDGLRKVRVVGNSARYLNLFSDAANSVVEENLLGSGGIFVWANLSHSGISKNTIVGGGIALRGASDNRIEGNSIRQSAVAGISLTDDANRNLVAGNSITGSAGDGIVLHAGYEHTGTTGNVIERNVVTGSGGNGVLLRSFRYRESPPVGQTDTVLRKNVIRNNTLDGIAVQEGSPGTVVERDWVFRNGDDGLDLKDPSTSVFGNRAWFNSDLGIEAVAGVTGGGNWAKHNGDPAQCSPASLCATRGRH